MTLLLAEARRHLKGAPNLENLGRRWSIAEARCLANLRWTRIIRGKADVGPWGASHASSKAPRPPFVSFWGPLDCTSVLHFCDSQSELSPMPVRSFHCGTFSISNALYARTQVLNLFPPFSGQIYRV
ncbi:hypothetical protein QN277_017243 [Acacia crassicarpa]|uniref:Uncharacterized protein n=1 Tax=Acacia crassicarpa TaxID=499986 RepID=A0AAE1JTP3_9FABA|nr:hypothetical protein QN277_017243 [Acacia crassicarpa]